MDSIYRFERPPREPGEATKKAVEMFRQGHDEGDNYVWQLDTTTDDSP